MTTVTAEATQAHSPSLCPGGRPGPPGFVRQRGVPGQLMPAAAPTCQVPAVGHGHVLAHCMGTAL